MMPVFVITLVGCGIKAEDASRWNAASQDAVERQLGPGAQFRNVVFVGKEAPATCGEVRSANSRSYERFIGFGPDEPILESGVEQGLFEEMWSVTCGTKS
jgi:hypothetical protein